MDLKNQFRNWLFAGSLIISFCFVLAILIISLIIIVNGIWIIVSAVSIFFILCLIYRFRDLKNWLFAKPNEEQVLIIGICSFVLAIILIPLTIFLLPENVEGVNGIWTLVTVFISSPVLFLIWRFRDQNISQQIENARKDTNLKEFQKLAEWVSGAHLVEDKVTTKTQWKEDNGKNKKVIEETREFTEPSKELSIQTYSKRDGATALQISAIYNLLPFYQGKYGESFRKPALNLLLSLWNILQEKEVNELESLQNELVHLVNKGVDDYDKKNEWQSCINKYEKNIRVLKERAHSPIGIAITQVLLSDGGDNLRRFKEVFPNICLAGMDFNLNGLDNKVLELFNQDYDYSNMKLQATNLSGVKINSNQNFNLVDFSGVDLSNAIIKKSNFKASFFLLSSLDDIEIIESSFDDSYILHSSLSGEILNSNFSNSFIINGSFSVEVVKSCFVSVLFRHVSDISKSKFKFTDLRNSSFGDDFLKKDDGIFFSLPSFDGSIINNDSYEISLSGVETKKNYAAKGLIYLVYEYGVCGNSNYKQKVIVNNGNEQHCYYIESFCINIDETRKLNSNWEIKLN